ncbi:DnaD domain protein [Agathobacter sp.]
MATINISSDIATSFTTVSDIFIDRYMPKANGEFVKVYLYLLRAIGSGNGVASISDIADHFSNTENDVIRALNYWASMGILQLSTDAKGNITALNVPVLTDNGTAGVAGTDMTMNGNVQSAVGTDGVVTANAQGVGNMQGTGNAASGSANSQFSGNTALSSNNADSSKAAGAPRIEKRKEYTLDEIKVFRNDPDVSELFFIIETYLKHTLSSSDTNLVLYWLDELHFTPDLIEYLVEYCITKGHSSLRYMDKVALGWADAGISTVDQAKDDAAAHSQIYYAVMKALGITGRNLVDSEITFINKWSGEYGFDIELIKEACGRTISNIHQPSFEYTDSILNNWRKKNVRSKKDIEVLDESFAKNRKSQAAAATDTKAKISDPKKNKFNNFNQRSHDYDKLEKLFLNSSV